MHHANAEGCEVMYQPPYLAELGLGEQLWLLLTSSNPYITLPRNLINA